jgi:hypothetical protein
MSIKYLTLPIYSIAVYGDYIYFAGGGGGSTGIPNEIVLLSPARKSTIVPSLANQLTPSYPASTSLKI